MDTEQSILVKGWTKKYHNIVKNKLHFDATLLQFFSSSRILFVMPYEPTKEELLTIVNHPSLPDDNITPITTPSDEISARHPLSDLISQFPVALNELLIWRRIFKAFVLFPSLPFRNIFLKCVSMPHFT